MNALELYVRRVADSLHENQLARLYKIPNDVKIVDEQLIHGEQGPGDFWGFTSSGRVILLECKHINQPSLALNKKALKPHQLRALTEVHRAGGIALVLWGNGLKIAVLDPDQIRDYSKGRKSVPWKSIPDRFKRAFVGDHLQLLEPHLSPRGLSDRRSPTPPLAP